MSVCFFRLLCFLLLAIAVGRVFAQEVLELGNAEFVLSSAISIPNNQALWRPQRLPDNWNLSRPGVGGYGWYRMTFRVSDGAARSYALYVPKLSMNAAIYVNGRFVSDGGTFDEPVARHWNRPLLFTIPPDLLSADGLNTLYVRLYAYPNSRGGLDKVHVGPVNVLKPIYERRYFVQTILPQLCNIVVASLGVFMLALWVRRRQESTYVFFFVFSMLWALRSTHMFVRDIPVSTFVWDIWVQSSFGWCALLFVALAIRYAGVRWRWFDATLLLYAIAGPVVMFAAGPSRLHAVASNWSFVIVPVAIFFEGFLIRFAWRERTVVSVLLAAVWALIIAASVHDGLVHRDKLTFDSFYWVSYIMILLSFVMGWILTNRFVQALVSAERLNVELEARVAQKHAELEANYRRIQAMERDSAVSEERNRIMSEMHDGIGAQLIATIDSVERGLVPTSQITQELREVLDGLRLTIDSLEPTDNDLLTVLGTLRYRLEGRLKRQGIGLEWEVAEVPKLSALNPQSVLHILRVLQEAFTNIIKHANAKTVTVRCGSSGAHAFVEVVDDGCGLRSDRQGRGLVSMRRRAQALQGALEIHGADRGTTVRLLVPLDAARTASFPDRPLLMDREQIAARVA